MAKGYIPGIGTGGGGSGGGIPEAPIDGETYARKDAGWVSITPPDEFGWVPNFQGLPDGSNAFIRLPTEWKSNDAGPSGGTDYLLGARYIQNSTAVGAGLLDGRGGTKAGDAAGFYYVRPGSNPRSFYGNYTVNDVNNPFPPIGSWQNLYFRPADPLVTTDRVVKYIGNGFGIDGADTSSESLLVSPFRGYITAVYMRDNDFPENTRYYQLAFNEQPTGTTIPNTLDNTGSTDGELVGFPPGNEWIRIALK